jgi:hypothetical protein
MPPVAAPLARPTRRQGKLLTFSEQGLLGTLKRRQTARRWRGNPRRAVDRAPYLRVHADGGRRSGDSNRRGGGSSGGREGEDGARDERADGANRENGRCEDVSPNAHVYLHAFTEVTA